MDEHEHMWRNSDDGPDAGSVCTSCGATQTDEERARENAELTIAELAESGVYGPVAAYMMGNALAKLSDVATSADNMAFVHAIAKARANLNDAYVSMTRN